MHNVVLDPIRLRDIITLLKKDNEEINETIKNINNTIKSLDETKWNSPEKTKINNELIPYIDLEEKNIASILNECIFSLNQALNTYSQTDYELKLNSSKLTDLRGE